MRTASCACGRLSADCRGEPASVSLCCCAQCQRRTGGAFGVAVFFAREAVTVRGEAAAYTRPSDSGQPVTFHFCPACGSSVYWEPHRKPDMVAVALGAFADPGFPRPGKAVYAERRPSWLAVETG
ncbi:GFA family protein [Phenylobacterium sp.]|uniref:GFA family protein n=1 Tax=Phenylobacterium sp. TaxID=1871053 RepID=UPI0035AF446D